MEIFKLCVLIFFCRILDVSLGTIRTIFSVRGRNIIASLIGFVELMIWFTIAREALNTNVESIWIGVSYALGYATGTLLGGYVSKLFIRPKITVQIVTSSRSAEVLTALREMGFPMTIVEAYGQLKQTEKYMVFVEIDSKKLREMKKILNQVDPKAFITVNEIKQVYNGYFGDK